MGNFFLLIATVICAIIFDLLYGNHSRSGDAGVGYAWAILFAITGFVIVTGISTIIAAKNGGFQWVAYQGSGRSFILFGAFAVAMWGAILFCMGSGFGDFPKFLAPLIKALPVLSLISIIASVFVLINHSEKLSTNHYWRLPIYIAIVIGIIATLISLVARVNQNIQNYQYYKQSKNQINENELLHIDTINVYTNFGSLLGSTDRYRDPQIRAKALEKIKSHPDWENELLKYLNSGWFPDVFTFLASNDVLHKDLFANAIIGGIDLQSQSIKKSISSYNYEYELYPEKYSWEIERILRTIEKFKDSGVDYKPAVIRLRAAFNEPTPFDKPDMNAVKLLDKWLKKN